MSGLRSRPEPKLLAGAGAGAGIKFWLRLRVRQSQKSYLDSTAVVGKLLNFLIVGAGAGAA
jgi:hypothetical protein